MFTKIVRPAAALGKSFSTSASLASASTISYRIPKPTDYDAVVQHMYDHFLVMEPMCAAMRLDQRKSYRIPDFDHYILSGLVENMSIIAVDDETGEVVGARVSGIAKKETYEGPDAKERYLKKIQDPVWKHWFDVLFEVNLLAGNFFDQLGTDTFLDFKAGSVHKDYQRKNIYKEMAGRSLMVGRMLGFEACKVECTGAFSQATWIQMGLKVLAENPYAEYKGTHPDTGERLFQDMGVHTATKLIAGRIPKFDHKIWDFTPLK